MLPALTIDTFLKGRKPLGSGVHRTGYRIDVNGSPFCVKVASYQDANVAEAGLWSRLADEDRALFCEVIAADPDGEWLVMPLCQPLAYSRLPEDADPSLYREEYPGSRDVVHLDYDTWRHSPEGRRARSITPDLHSGNVMRHPDGRIVVTDYGFGDDPYGWDGLEPSGTVSPSSVTCCQGEGRELDCSCTCADCLVRYEDQQGTPFARPNGL